jgi:hypothetical protein
MKYAVEMGSGAMIYIPSFIKIGPGFQKLIRGHTRTHRQHGGRISLLLFIQNKESRQKMLVRAHGAVTSETSSLASRWKFSCVFWSTFYIITFRYYF